MPKYSDITNQRFGRLTALQPTSGRDAAGNVLWQCRCICGNRKIASATCLKEGKVRSCGCLLGNLTHGHTRKGRFHPLYWAWHRMRARCNNPNIKEYKYYGALGVKVCDRWNDFSIYLSDIFSSIGNRPPGMSLDRYPNKNGNYEPGNVRWATPKQQNRNKRPYKRRR